MKQRAELCLPSILSVPCEQNVLLFHRPLLGRYLRCDSLPEVLKGETRTYCNLHP